MAQKISDEQRVIDYLSRLMAGKFFKVEDLDSLTAGDLLHDTPIQDVEREVVENTLEFFKKRYKSEIFKDS